MDWLSLIGLVLRALLAALTYLQQQGAIDAGKAQAIAGHLKDAADAVTDARQIAAAQRARTSSNPADPAAPADPAKLRSDSSGLFRD